MVENDRIPLPVLGQFTRRTAVKGIGATLGAAAFVAAISPLRKLAGEISAAEFMQQQIPDLPDLDTETGGELDAECCPACGARTKGASEECPDCGLALL